MENREKQNNLKLEVCLKNVQNAIILLEINDRAIENRLKSALAKSFGVKMICFQDVQNDFISLLSHLSSNQQQQKICFYAFEHTPVTYDIVKSLNLSRELLRNIGILIFMMPSFLVKQIENEEPNLQDYILLKLDYTVRQDIPFEPKFSVQYFSQYEKKEQRNLRQHAPNARITGSIRLSQYFSYLQSFQYKRMSHREYEKHFKKAFSEITSYLSRQRWLNPHEQITVWADVWQKTAQTLAAQNYLKAALDLFTEMSEYLTCNDPSNIYYLYALEGRAFCFYHLMQYENAKKDLLLMVNLLETSGTENDDWKYRVYNDYAACLYKSGNFEKAYQTWKICENALQELHIGNMKHIYQNKYNLLLVDLTLNTNLYKHYSKYLSLKDQLLKNFGENSTLYSEYQLLMSWINGILLGKTEFATQQAYASLQKNRTLLQENSFEIALSYYVISKLYKQQDDDENATVCMKKCTNVLKNCRLTNQYLLFLTTKISV